MVVQLRNCFGVSERRACKVVGQHRSTQARDVKVKDSDEVITKLLKHFALKYPKRGYKKAYRWILEEDFILNIKRVHRLWIKAGLRVPFTKKKRRSGHGKSMGGHSPIFPNGAFSCDFQFDQTTDWPRIKMLNSIDEYSREILATTQGRSITSRALTQALDVLLFARGTPKHLLPDYGPEFIAKAIRNWADEMGVTMYYIDPGSPWQNSK